MGPICFDFGFGPFRWVCTSGDPADLATTDAIAAEVLEELAAHGAARDPPADARQPALDPAGRARTGWWSARRRASSTPTSEGRRAHRRRLQRAPSATAAISAPVVLGRDHHDVSGTDSPYRETANIRDGSSLCADMAVQNVIGDAFRGATWVSLHNGGGVGWGEVINGGFGLLLDGSADADRAPRPDARTGT